MGQWNPDKNPKATPLFQAISTASEKLSDTTTRKKEEAKANKELQAKLYTVAQDKSLLV